MRCGVVDNPVAAQPVFLCVLTCACVVPMCVGVQLLHMVLSSREAMDKNAAQAAQCLLNMDVDGVRASHRSTHCCYSAQLFRRSVVGAIVHRTVS